jgi:regulatory protein
VEAQGAYLLDRARKFCSYQERCIYDVKQKLLEWSASQETIERIIRRLEEEDFINEERFAVSFALGKLRHNKWGKNKIFYALSRKHIPELYVQMGLSEIDEKEYLDTLKTVLKSKQIKDPDPGRRQNKLAKYAIQKGFAPDLVWNVLRNEVQ